MKPTTYRHRAPSLIALALLFVLLAVCGAPLVALAVVGCGASLSLLACVLADRH